MEEKTILLIIVGMDFVEEEVEVFKFSVYIDKVEFLRLYCNVHFLKIYSFAKNM